MQVAKKLNAASKWPLQLRTRQYMADANYRTCLLYLPRKVVVDQVACGAPAGSRLIFAPCFLDIASQERSREQTSATPPFFMREGCCSGEFG